MEKTFSVLLLALFAQLFVPPRCAFFPDRLLPGQDD